MFFPLDEADELIYRLNNGLDTYTTRISLETNKYKLNNVYDTNLGIKIKVIDILYFNNIDEHPFINELSEINIKELNKYNTGQFELIKFIKYTT